MAIEDIRYSLLPIRYSLFAIRHSPHITARITRPTLSKISPICASLTINGGAMASVSPVMRITKSSSWNARSIAS